MNDTTKPTDPSAVAFASATAEADYWNSLISEIRAAEFLGFTVRCLQGWRYRSGGPNFVKIGAGAVRYRRADLRVWADARMRSSTSDPGSRAA